jgi:hypothetical protein
LVNPTLEINQHAIHIEVNYFFVFIHIVFKGLNTHSLTRQIYEKYLKLPNFNVKKLLSFQQSY